MCRNKGECSELGPDPGFWDKECPLRRPEWFDGEICKFVESLECLLQGNRSACHERISEIKSNEMAEWFIEHGQMSGRHRKRLLDLPKPDAVPIELRDPVRSPRKFQTVVFERDGYHCRYCGGKLISQNVLKLFVKNLGSNLFRKGPTNISTHGIIHIAWPVADHVLPWNMGGKTDLHNLVASCGACNYGKDGYTCD